jgi:protein PhnA
MDDKYQFKLMAFGGMFVKRPFHHLLNLPATLPSKRMYLGRLKHSNMSTYPPCPQCKSAYTYELGDLFACPECAHEWLPAGLATEKIEAETVVKDSNGNVLQNGDSVVVIKNLPVKGFSKDIKIGTKVKNIKLVEGDHNIDCKIEGFGSMALKSEFVRKA